MNITEVRIRNIFDQETLKAIVSITVDHDFAVHDLKIVQGPDRLFVAMPSKKDQGGAYRDVAHPITKEARELMEAAILHAYEDALRAQPDDASGEVGLPPSPADPDESGILQR